MTERVAAGCPGDADAVEAQARVDVADDNCTAKTYR